jgi:hypothetical protein
VIALDLDIRDFERKARDVDAMVDQVPFALAQAMNRAVKDARESLIHETWPSAVTVRNPYFLRASFHMEFARASDWRHRGEMHVAIADTMGRAHLAAHAYGGEKTARGRLAIPPSSGKVVIRTGHGVRKNQTPRAIIDHTPKHALRIIPGKGIFVGEGGRLWLHYSFKARATIRQDVPFVSDFRSVMIGKVQQYFPQELAKAMASRRPR